MIYITHDNWQIQMLLIVWTFRHFDPNFVLWFSCYSIESIDKAIEIDIIFQNLTYFEVNCIHFQKSWKIKTVPNAAWLHGPKEKTKGEEYDVGFFFFLIYYFLKFWVKEQFEGREWNCERMFEWKKESNKW